MMEITKLKQILEDTRGVVNSIVFDAAEFLNQTANKDYPLVFWDIDNSRWTKHRRKVEQTLIINVYCLGQVNNSDPCEAKWEAWRTLENVLDAYLVHLEKDMVTVINDTIEKEYYPAGMLSIDNEFAVRYNLTLKLWC